MALNAFKPTCKVQNSVQNELRESEGKGCLRVNCGGFGLSFASDNERERGHGVNEGRESESPGELRQERGGGGGGE